VPSFHPLLTNTASMLAGIRRYYKRKGRDVTCLALAGDGGAADVGFQSLSGAAERGEEILFVVIDNEGYMNTGMQRSSTTPLGSWTSTTPVGPALQGKPREAKYMPLIMLMHSCEYVATASMAYPIDFHEKIEKAYQASKRGFAYVHVFSPCTTGWRFPGDMNIAVQRKAVETNYFPLWEYERSKDKLVFTYPVDEPKPLESYLSVIGKFRHLSKDQINQLREQAIKRMSVLQRIAELGLSSAGTKEQLLVAGEGEFKVADVDVSGVEWGGMPKSHSKSVKSGSN
jgi:phenylglyoxylate dehydrogenase beta subunit